jgi:hypothetical protein
MPTFSRFDDFGFSWYASDQDGHVAAFSTEGTRIVPALFSMLTDTELFMLGEGVHRMSRSNGALAGRGAPTGGVGEQGFFTSAADSTQGPEDLPITEGVYELERAPDVSLFNIEIDEKTLKAMRIIPFRKICFAKQKTITKEMIGNEGIRLVCDP